MSLINDALKQTQKIQQQNPPPSRPPPLPPVESNSPEGLGWLVPGIIVLLLAAVGIFIGLSLSKPTRLAASAMPATNSAPVAATTPKPVQTVVVAPTAVTNASPVAVVSPKLPQPRLQGILFAATKPCAIVSGQTVFVGDQVGKFRVAAISKNSVTLQNEAETNVLSLSPQ
jgi:hypothetical protein